MNKQKKKISVQKLFVGVRQISAHHSKTITLFGKNLNQYWFYIIRIIRLAMQLQWFERPIFRLTQFF